LWARTDKNAGAAWQQASGIRQIMTSKAEGDFIRYAIRYDTIIQLCNLVCRKIENDALAQVAAFKGVSNTSAKKKSQSG
jgi:hypothetical protein